MTLMYANINVSEGIGTSIINVIKGSAQLVAGVIDQALATNLGVTELMAVGIALAAVAWMLSKAREAKHHAVNLF